MNRHFVRSIALLLSLLLVTSLGLWWLGGQPHASSTDAAPATLESAPLQIRELRLGLNIAAGSALHAAAMKFAEQVSAQSQGKIKVTVFPDQKLGSDDQMLEMARNGTLDLVLTPTAKISSAIPAMQYADLPFYFASREELYAMLDGEPGRMLLTKLNTIDLVGLSFWENGFKQFTANTPIRSPKDFADLRIRTMKSPLIADQFASLGAQPIPIDFHATYQALADGAVDGQENPLVAIVAMRFHEVQKHLTLSNHAYLGYVFAVSKRVFETLPPDQREIIQSIARELTVWERQETARREVEFIAKIRAAGVTIHTPTPAEAQQFRTAMAPIADKFGFAIGYDLLAKTQELRHFKRMATPLKTGNEPFVLGLDADLTNAGAQAGGAILRGMQLAVDEINRDGGLLGRPVTIVARDHSGNPGIGRQNLALFASLPSLLAVMGGMQTSVITEQLDEIHQHEIPYLVPWAAGAKLNAHQYKPSYIFRVSISDHQVAPFLLAHALKLGGRVAVLLEQSAWGRSYESALKPLIDKLPAGSVEISWIVIDDPGLDAKLANLLSRHPGALIMIANPMESRAVVRAMVRQPRPVPILAPWGLTGGDFYPAMQTALQTVDLRFVQSILASDEASQPRLGRFLKRYRARYSLASGAPVPALMGSLHAYELTQMLARAVRQAKRADRPAIRQALETLPSHAGILREYRPPFEPDRHDALDGSLLHLARFDRRGHIVQAE